MISFLKAALIILIVSFGLWIYEHEFDHTLPFHQDLDVWLSILGAFLLVFFVIVALISKFFGTTSKWRRKYRCVRCGAKIGKNEMYCPKHKSEIANEFLHGRTPEKQ